MPLTGRTCGREKARAKVLRLLGLLGLLGAVPRQRQKQRGNPLPNQSQLPRPEPVAKQGQGLLGEWQCFFFAKL